MTLEPYRDSMSPPQDAQAAAPTWQCEFCGRFYSERTAKDHAYCIQAYDRQCAEKAGTYDV